MRAMTFAALLGCSACTWLLAFDARGRTVPKDPGFFTRLVGGGHPQYVTRAVHLARRAPAARRGRILNAAFKAGLRRGDLSVYSAIKLARSQPSEMARNVMLRTFAQVNRDALTVSQVLKLGWSTTRTTTHRRLLRSYRKHNASRLAERDHGRLNDALGLLAPKPKPKPKSAPAATSDWTDPLGVNPNKLERNRRAAAQRFVDGTSGGTMETLRDGLTMSGKHEQAARLDQANAALNGDWEAMIQAGLRAQALKNNARFNPFK